MEVGWSTAIQALIIAISTVVMRVAAKKDKEEVKRNTSTPDDVRKVRDELLILRAEFNILKDAYFRNNPVIDHRSPGVKNAGK